MTDIPRSYVIKPNYDSETSEIAFRAKVSTAPLKAQLKELESLRYHAEQPAGVRTESAVVLKTKNPLYNPIKWLKTKNPTYNNRKWIKTCFLGRCAKTKNPLYDPKKWIKTKNPAYSPNKYTEVRASIAYISEYNLDVYVDGRTQYTPFAMSGANITVPVRAKGWFSLIVPGVPVPFVRVPFEGKLELDADARFSIVPEWCMGVSTDFDFHWMERLKMDLSYGLGLAEVDLTDLVNPLLDSAIADVEKSLLDGIDCEALRADAEKAWKTQEFQVSEQHWAVVKPTATKLSNLVFSEDFISITGALDSEISIGPKLATLPDAGDLPNLDLSGVGSPSISLSIPIETKYDYLDLQLKKALVDNPLEFGEEGSPVFGTVNIKDIETFPNGPNIGLKVKFETIAKPSLLSVKARAYFTGQLSHFGLIDTNRLLKTEKHFIQYSLDDLAFSDFGNGRDKLVLAAAYSTIKGSLNEDVQVDITEQMDEVEKGLVSAVARLVFQINESQAQDPESPAPSAPEITDTSLSIKNWGYDRDSLQFLFKAKATYNDQ